MSNTKQKPLLSDNELREMRDNRSTISTYPVHAWLDGAMDIRDTYEAARAKDAELIQMLVDDLRLLRIEFGNRLGQTTQIGIASLSDAEAAGFKPSER